jgi:hypothetical protein
MQNALGHPVHKRSIFSWLRDDDDQPQKVEETLVTGYKPILEVHKYNGLQINPINGGPPMFFESGAPITLEQLNAGSDQQIANLLYNAVPLLPEEERMHEVNLGPIAPYVQMIPDASIDRLRVTFESDGEERVGSQGKSKLLKLLQVIKEKKLKPFKALYQKKKDAIKSVVNFLSPPPPPPPPSSDTVIVQAPPAFYALPPPPIFSHPPPIHLLGPPSPPELEFLKFEHPSKHSFVTQGVYFEQHKEPETHNTETRLGEGHVKKDPCAPKDTKCEEHHYTTSFNAPTAHDAAPFFHSVNVDHIPPPPPPPTPFHVSLAPPPMPEEHHHFVHARPHAYSLTEDSPRPYDLQTSESENVERFSAPLPARVEFIDERTTSVLQTPKIDVTTVVASTTPQATPQSYKGELENRYYQS